VYDPRCGKILVDDILAGELVKLFCEQKRKALEDSGIAEQRSESLAQNLSRMDHDMTKVLERSAVGASPLSELTEYLGAKEMQLETLSK
jgi:hypothetical protein